MTIKNVTSTNEKTTNVKLSSPLYLSIQKRNYFKRLREGVIRKEEMEAAFKSLNKAVSFCKAGVISQERYFRTAIELARPFSPEEDTSGWGVEALAHLDILLKVADYAKASGLVQQNSSHGRRN